VECLICLANRPARAFGQVSEEILTHLISQVGVDVEITVTIVAKKDEGFSPKTISKSFRNSSNAPFKYLLIKPKKN
jgi:hypothetical protein